MFLDVSFDVNKLADQIQHVLGQYGPMVWDMAVRQQIIKGAISTVVSALFLAGTVVGTKVAFYWAGRAKKEEDSDYYIGTVLGGIAALICILVILAILPDAINHLLNPGWFAIQDLRP